MANYMTATIVFFGDDYSKEPFSIRIPVKVPFDGDGNFDPLGLPALTSLAFDANSPLKLAIESIMIADITSQQLHIGQVSDRIYPNDKWAQKEIRAKVKYRDTQWNKMFEFTIPCVDWDAVVYERTDKVNMGLAQIVALKAALELYCQSPYQNSIVVEDIELVGRPK